KRGADDDHRGVGEAGRLLEAGGRNADECDIRSIHGSCAHVAAILYAIAVLRGESSGGPSLQACSEPLYPASEVCPVPLDMTIPTGVRDRRQFLREAAMALAATTSAAVF